MNGYQALANAIIEQAARDYLAARKKLGSDPHSPAANKAHRDIEMFFRSAWFAALTAADGELILKLLKEESDT